MRSTIIIAVAALCVASLSSCGTNKKLAASEAQVADLRASNDNLQKKNESLQKNVDQLNGQVSTLSSQNTTMSTEYAEYKKKCAEIEEKYLMAQAVLDREAEILAKVEEKLEAALEDFKEKGVEVEYKNGYVFVSLPDELMYKSGSAVLDQKGKQALAPIASILADYPNLKVIVLGNTDDVQFKKSTTDNWSLSTERANTVVRVFRDMYKVDPVRLTAAGKGKYNPVADNGTAEGRARNRRTDIILNPDFDKIWLSAAAQR